jgi:hypothetical protein
MKSWMGPFMALLMGTILVIVSLVLFGVGLDQYDTAMTTANTTTNDIVGLYEIMGPTGILLFLAFFFPGIGMLIGGGVQGYKMARGGGGGRSRRR